MATPSTFFITSVGKEFPGAKTLLADRDADGNGEVTNPIPHRDSYRMHASILGGWGSLSPDFGMGVVGVAGGSWTGLGKCYRLFLYRKYKNTEIQNTEIQKYKNKKRTVRKWFFHEKETS